MSAMSEIRVAVIEDDLPTSNQFKAWIEAAKPGIHIDQWFNRDDAEAAIVREQYDLVVLDIELGRESLMPLTRISVAMARRRQYWSSRPCRRRSTVAS